MAIEIMELAEHEWALQVQVSEVGEVSYHKVRVAPDDMKDLGVSDERTLVLESVETYLAHCPSTSLPKVLTLNWIENHLPEFRDELTSRLA